MTFMTEQRAELYRNDTIALVGRRMVRAMVALAALGFALALSSAQAGPNLVTNPGFEAGTFLGWTGIGDTSFNGVQCPGPGATVFQGNCSAFFGAVGGTGGITQTINSLIVNNFYAITFAFRPDGGTPSSLLATFGGVNLLSLNNLADGPYQVFTTIVRATSGSEALAFNFRNDQGFFFLDAVSVSQVPEPGTLALISIGLVGVWAGRRRKAH
jgi:PEP-CTERM motif